MKKTLLFGMALLGSTIVYAQAPTGGTVITPEGYQFNNLSELPIYPTYATAANFTTSDRNGKGVWMILGNGAQEFWDAHNGMIGCAFVADADMMSQIMEGTQIVDLGGDVGKVMCWQGCNSNLKDVLVENYPDQDWSNIPAKLSTGVKQTWNFNFWLNPKSVWTKGMGFYRFRMIVNACHHATDEDIENGIYDFSGDNVIKEVYQVNNQGNNTSFIYTGEVDESGDKVNKSNSDVGVVPSITNDLFVKRTANGTIIPNRYGDPMWDPTKWVIVDYYFNVAGNNEGKDENGDVTIPVRVKMGMSEKMNNLAILIKEISITQFDGELTQDIYDLNKESFATVILTPGGPAGVDSLVDDSNAPVEYYNLQGVKVANPDKGIFIRKQGKTTKKVIF